MHEQSQHIIAYFDTRSTNFFAQHDYTVSYWFRLEQNLNWDKLTAYLKDCDENYLASRIESGEVFGDPDAMKLPFIHHTKNRGMTFSSHTNNEEKPCVKSKTKVSKNLFPQVIIVVFFTCTI